MKVLEDRLNMPTEIVEDDNVEISNTRDLIKTVEGNLEKVFDGADDRFVEDFEIIRDNVKEIISDTKRSFKSLSVIARDSEKASDFMALSSLTKTLLDANKQILEMYEMKKKYQGVAAATPAIGINNSSVVFTGTTKDLRNHLLKNNGS